VRIFGLMAIAILLIACINFMNLSTARSHRRAKEVGIRKTMGSSRWALVRQFFVESFMFCGLASCLALLILSVGLPAINRLLQTDLHIPYTEGAFWAGFCGVFFLTALLAGSYPSLYLASLKPIKVLSGVGSSGKGVLWLRQSLVVFQFTIALFMIVAIAVIFLELRYIHDRPIGFETANLLEIPLDQTLGQKVDVLADELRESGLTVSTCPLSHSLNNIWRNGWGLEWPGKKSDEKLLVSFLGVGYGFAGTAGIQLVKGRDFLPDHPTDSMGVLINETAASAMQLSHPVGSQLRSGGQTVTVIGVFKDFVFTSPFKKTPPLLVYLNGPGNAGFLDVRLNHSASLAGTVQGLETILKRIDPGYPPVIHFVDQDFEQNYEGQQLTSSLASLFGGLAIVLCCMGLLGLTIFAAELRRKEISIRKVLGASVYRITRLLSADFLKLVLVAAVIAFPLGWWAMHSWLQQFDYRVTIGWWLFPAVIVFGFLIAQGTMLLQTLKAATENPVKNLKRE
jgi:putative ABC transport system permease protein